MPIIIDIKYAIRLLFKSPKFTAMTLMVLVGGLSISLFTFSFLYSTLYKDLPLPEGDTALSISAMINGDYSLLTPYEFAHLKSEQTVLEEFGVYDDKNYRLSFGDAGKNIPGSNVDEGFFRFSRTSPLLGRTIVKEDMQVGATAVAVISFQVWQNELAASEEVLNETLVVNDVVTEIIGVMPEGYRFPGTAKIWLPLSDDDLNLAADAGNYFYSYGRIKAAGEHAQALLELNSLLDNIYQQNVALYDLEKGKKSLQLLTFPFAQTGGEGTIIFAFLNAIAWMILLLACINVGNLLLARSIERQKETAIRAALGATNKRLISQLMWEGIIITTLGGVLSVLLVGAALHYTNIILHSWMPDGMVFWWQWGMDRETIVMAIIFTLATIFLSSFLPAWRSANQDINSTLRDGTRGAQSKKAGRLSRFLVTTQVFLVAILMLIGAMSAFISLKFINLDLGDDYTNVMTARINLPVGKYPEPEQKIAFYQNLLEELKSHPKVVDVVTNNWMGESELTMDNMDYPSDYEKPKVDVIGTMGKTSTIGVNLLEGRYISHLDKEGSRKIAMISQSMAKRYWPGESVLGKYFKVEINGENEKLFIIAVVTDRLNPRTILGKIDSADEIYISGFQFSNNFQAVYYRIHGDLAQTEEIFYQALFKADRNLDLFYPVQPAMKNRSLMRDVMSLVSNLTFSTGFFALLLALVGIYGLTANSVAQRTHEIGIRRAVGATDKNIVQMFLKQGRAQLIRGLGLALVLFALLAFAFNKFSESMFPVYLYAVLALTVVVGLSCVVMLAIYAPTRRAVKMEPSSALRYE
ncbi:MAG: ABC transporter permease [Colwellia sp.]|nr:ABC transporter permease [Colwellia sp.]